VRLAALASRADALMAVVDHPDVAERIDAALAATETRLDVIIDIDPGIARTGVASPDAAVALARVIEASANLEYRGVQFYCGSQQHIESYAERRAAIVERTAYLQQVIAALTDAGFAPPIVTGSGTGTHRIDLELGSSPNCRRGAMSSWTSNISTATSPTGASRRSRCRSASMRASSAPTIAGW
jgi:3-hydroxy-D-aspartate aldolase